LESADQALIFDSNGSVNEQSNLPQAALDESFVANLHPQKASENEPEAKSDAEDVAILEQAPEANEDIKSRSGSDFSLYKFLVKGANRWQMLVFLTALSTMAFMERLPGNCLSTLVVLQQCI
jgi:hypothetical protein